MKLLTPVRPTPPPAGPAPRPLPRTTARPHPKPGSGGSAAGFPDPLVTALFASLAAELSLPCRERPSRDEAVRAYGDDVNRLYRAAEEADRFRRRVLDHYLADTPDPAVRAGRAADLGRALPPLPPPDNVLSADLLARSDDPGRDLTAAVRAAAARLAAGVVATLHVLAADRVCGRIDWPRADLCRFTYFEEALTRTVTKTRKRKRKAGTPPPPSSGRRVSHIDTVTEVETTTDHRRWTAHEQHLVDATAVARGTPGGPSRPGSSI
jgi:hypothetical protein